MSNQPKDLGKQYQSAWDALRPLRESWDEREKTLLAQTTDSFSGSVTKARVTDAALSTLSYERQARVAAQLSTGKVYAAGKKDEAKAKLANIVLHRYIVPNADSQFPMLIKQRLWGVYASVYDSMPMFYDYRVDDRYIGPDCWLIDPRNYLPQPGRSNPQDCDWVMVSNDVNVSWLKSLLKKKSTSYDKTGVKKLLAKIDNSDKVQPSKETDAEKRPVVKVQREDSSQVEGKIEVITKYENGDDGRWVSFAPDYDNIIIRDIKNPHKSGRIPVVMRHCFPLLNSMYGLGDFARGIKVQKAKDSLLGLRLEYVKNKVFPPLKIDTAGVVPSTIKYGNRKWLVKDMNAVQAMTFGAESGNDFQQIYSVLNTIQQNQFGTSDTSVSSEDSANGSYGKTPQALKMLEQRENARDTWDRFMHEKAVEELYEGMLNLLSVKMEKPINFSIFEDEIRQIAEDYEDQDILDILDKGKYGIMTLSKSDIKPSIPYTYLVDANSSMKKDDQAQMETLTQLLELGLNPGVQQILQQSGYEWDIAEHLKSVLINSGVTDWERILKEVSDRQVDPATGQPVQGQVSPEEQAMAEQQMLAEQQAAQEEAIKSEALDRVNTIPPELEQVIGQTFGQGEQNG